jgi:hypothetical protein
MWLVCDPCRKEHDHDRCARSVHAFVEQDGPNWYSCECSCNQRRRRRETADRKVQQVVGAYRREFGDEAMRDLLAEMLPLASTEPTATAER